MNIISSTMLYLLATPTNESNKVFLIIHLNLYI